MHSGQIHLGVEDVRELIQGQFPAWSSLSVREVSPGGTLNAVFRVGSKLAARFQRLPRDPVAVQADLDAEVALARELFENTSFSVPEPVALGQPGRSYPLPWSVQTWVPGTTAAREDPGGSTGFALDLAKFIGEVRSIDTKGRTFSGSGRGGALPDSDDWLEECFRESEGLLEVSTLRGMWTRFRELPDFEAHAMCHGDLTPDNVLVEGGQLAGVIDTCGLAAADPSLDLVAAWHLLEEHPREVLRDQLSCDELEWERGKAWAFQQAMGLVWYYRESRPSMSRWGRRTLERLLMSR